VSRSSSKIEIVQTRRAVPARFGMTLLVAAATAWSYTSAGMAQLTAAAVLQMYHQAISRDGASLPQTWQAQGTLTGAHLTGTFASWHDAEHDRLDQNLGIRQERTLRIGDRQYLQNSSGDVIELKGLLLRRSRTQDFITSTDLFRQPQYARVTGRSMLPDGRDVFALEVAPPDGEPETMDIDTRTHLLDRLEYVDGDGVFTIDFFDYRPVNGALFSFKQVQSDGDHPYDVTQTVTQIDPKPRIPPVRCHSLTQRA